MKDIISGTEMPILALRGIAVFPEQTVHFDIGRMKSALALEAAMKKDQILFLVPQKDLLDEDPDLAGLYSIGTVVRVKQILKPQGDNVRVLVVGLHRASLTALTQDAPYLAGRIDPIVPMPYTESLRTKAMRRDAAALYGSYCEIADHPAQGVNLKIMASEDCGYIADTIAQNSGFDYRDKARLLAQINPVRRLENAMRCLRLEVQMLQLESDIQERTKAQIDQNQRDYYLREQMKVIREELGETDEYEEFAEYEKNILLLSMSQNSCGSQTRKSRSP